MSIVSLAAYTGTIAAQGVPKAVQGVPLQHRGYLRQYRKAQQYQSKARCDINYATICEYFCSFCTVQSELCADGT